jgi:acetyl esterase
MNMSAKTIRRLAVIIGILITAGSMAAAARLEPTYKNVSYGPHERDLLDFWKADSAKPTPLVIYIHGGGFYSGGKEDAGDEDIKKCLAHGVSFVSISYPYYQDVALHGIIRDNIARSLQFLRYKSGEWNIDKSKIAVFGESAGAGSSLWLAVHDDIADPAAADPVLRESSRVAAAGLLDTQATYDLPAWNKLFENVIDKRTMKAWNLIMHQMELDMYHLKNDKEWKTQETEAIRRDLDMLSMMDKNDPPIIMVTLASELTGGDLLHHTRHPKAVKEKCDSAGMECVLILDETPADQRIDMVDFLIEHLK